MGASGIGPVGRTTDQWSTRTGREPPDGALFRARAQATQTGQAGQPPPQNAGPSSAEVALDLAQLTLDVAGIFDPTPISDGSNAIISLFRGDVSGAVISGVSMIPYLGDTAKLAKLPRLAETLGKVADLVRANPAAAAALRGAVEKLGALLDKAPIDSLPEAVRGPVQTLKGKFDEAMSAMRSSETPASQVPVSQQPAVPVGAADGANGGGPATGAGTGSAGARGAEDKPPPTAAGGGDGPVDGGGGSRPTANGPDEPDRPGGLGPEGTNGGKPAEPNGAGGPPRGRLSGTTEALEPAEKDFVEELLNRGHDVEVIPTAKNTKEKQAERTADFKVDGVRTELKTLSGVVDQTSDGLSKALSSRVMDARGQSGTIIVDARGQPGMTRDIAERGLARAFGADRRTGGGLESVTVLTPDGTVTRGR